MSGRFSLLSSALMMSALLTAIACGRPAPSAATTSAPSSAATALYRCPMHPEIARDKPGQCPICNMALEPIGAAAASASPQSTGRSHDMHAP